MINEAKLIDMPCHIKGFSKITAEPEGDYPTIAVNARLTYETNVQTLIHENEHLEDDLTKTDVDEIEKERHGL